MRMKRERKSEKKRQRMDSELGPSRTMTRQAGVQKTIATGVAVIGHRARLNRGRGREP